MARIRTLLVALVAALVLTGGAQAAGGNYVFDGGNARQQGQVKAALNASSFNWSIVPAQITIHIARGINSEATRGNIWLDSDLVDSGTFAWGTVQHEYAHQVDFFLLDDVQHLSLLGSLGGQSWWQNGTAGHGQLGSERFASTLAWTYWQSKNNSMKPESKNDESAAVAPAKFKTLMGRLLPGAQMSATVAR